MSHYNQVASHFPFVWIWILLAAISALSSFPVLGLTSAGVSSISSSLSLSPPPPLSRRPIVYTIAGSDSGGGAGIQADLHAMHNFGCHACAAITCLTAQNSVAVTHVHTPPASFLEAQLDALRTDLPPVAIKIGMLGTRELAVQVGQFLQQIKIVAPQNQKKVWVVLDPVMISTSGNRLIEQDAQQAMIDFIFPLADVLTPNKFEAEALLGRKLDTVQDFEQGARDLLSMGVAAVLIKGGHTMKNDADESSVVWAQDYFLSRDDGNMPDVEPRLCDGALGVWLRSPRYETEHTHGTGCTLSSSIASVLALGEVERSLPEESRRGALSSISPVDACCLAKAYVTAGIHESIQLGQGPGPVAHTCFPRFARHYPSIVLDASSMDNRPFRPIRAFSSSSDGDGEMDHRLGRILPIVDSVDWVRALCEVSGVADLQLRIKNEQEPARILKQVQQSQALCKAAGIRLWINDNWEAAIQAGCFGVHLGQEDLYKCIKAGGLKGIRDKNMALGISTHSFGELSAALGVKPSYVSLGPIFATSSKKVQFDPQGLSIVTKWRELVPPNVPLVCIGGIGDAKATAEVRRAGADCVAVIEAVTQAPDKANAVFELNQAAS